LLNRRITKKKRLAGRIELAFEHVAADAVPVTLLA